MNNRIIIGLKLGICLLAGGLGTLQASAHPTVADLSTSPITAEDATAAFQEALDSGEKHIRVPKLDHPWVLGPVTLRSNMVIEFDKGVQIRAKKGEFVKRYTSLISGRGIENVQIIGNGLVVTMNKAEYQQSDHPFSEWRHGIALHGVKNVQIEDVTVVASGGDGFYIGNGNQLQPRGRQHLELELAEFPNYSENVVLRRVSAIDNHRQGLSIITGRNILVEDSLFADTKGTPPQAGVDIEPNRPYEILENIVLRNVVSRNNEGSGFEVHLGRMKDTTTEVSILLENCRVEGGSNAFSMRGPGGDETRLQGTIEIKDFYAENTRGPAVNLRHFPVGGLRLLFNNAAFHSVSLNDQFSPIWFQIRQSETYDQGGVVFNNVLLETDATHPVIRFHKQDKNKFAPPEPGHRVGAKDISGKIRVKGKVPKQMKIDEGLDVDISLTLE